MTSYIPKPTLDSSYLDPSSQAESILGFWKSSKNPRYLGDRRCNRSWRLINDKLLTNSNKCYHKSVLKLHDRPLYESPPSHQVMIKNRPSLFSNNSKSTAESNLSLRSPDKHENALDSADDTSDLSEDDDDYSGSDCDSIHMNSSKPANGDVSDAKPEVSHPRPAWGNHGMQLLAKSATSPLGQSNSGRSNIFYISNSPASPSRLYRNGSASSLTHSKTPEKPAGSTHTPDPVAAASVSNGIKKATLSRQDSLFAGRADMRAAPLDQASSASSSDISEDDEYDFEDPKDGDLDHSLEDKVSKSSPSISGKDRVGNVTLDKIPRSSEDNDSEWLSASSDGEPLTESPKRTPLSFAKRIPGANSSESTLSKSPVCSEFSGASSKPRSLLSGLFSNDVKSHASSSSALPKNISASETSKPVLKRSSTTGVITVEEITKDKKMVSKPSILYSKKYASLSDISRRLPPQRSPVTFPINSQQNMQARIPNSKRQDPLFAKQTSSVGVSNLMVLAEGTGSPESRSRNINQNPKVKSAENITLSSSLSKYSSSLNQPSSSSLKNLLSNSAINISSILGHGISNKLRSSKQNRSSEALKGSDEDLSSSFAGYLSRQHSRESTRPEIPLSRSVRVTPTKEFEPSVEISKSLKDSLMIDHKLGKRPMPERVISDEDLFLGHDKRSFLQDENDYHSKGW